MMRNFKENGTYFLLKLCDLSIPLATTQSQSQRQPKYTSINQAWFGIRTIIDGILLLCSKLDAILLYLECVCKVFLKYWVSFRIEKCEFIKTRVEYVGHDITKSGDYPAHFKFDLINNWILPLTGKYLFSVIELVSFYHLYTPFFEIRLDPLRIFFKQYYLKPILLMAWTPQLITLFSEI